MKREEVKAIIEGITDEQLGKLMDMNSADIGKAKSDYEAVKGELETAKGQLSERDNTIKSLEAAGTDADALKAELDKYKLAEEERQKKVEAENADAVLTKAAETALEGKEFVNDFTRGHFLNEIKTALSNPENKGKGAGEIFEALTKDVDGIFKNPQQEQLNIPPSGFSPGKGEEDTIRAVMGLPPLKG